MFSVRIADHTQNRDQKYTRILYVHNEDGLNTALDQIMSGGSAYFDIFSPEGDTLTIGIAGEYGFVQFTNRTGDPPYLVATHTVDDKQNLIEFDIDGTPTPVPTSQCLTLDDVVHIVICYFKNGALSKQVEWEAL